MATTSLAAEAVATTTTTAAAAVVPRERKIGGRNGNITYCGVRFAKPTECICQGCNGLCGNTIGNGEASDTNLEAGNGCVCHQCLLINVHNRVMNGRGLRVPLHNDPSAAAAAATATGGATTIGTTTPTTTTSSSSSIVAALSAPQATTAASSVPATPLYYCGRRYTKPGDCECGSCMGVCEPSADTVTCACPDCRWMSIGIEYEQQGNTLPPLDLTRRTPADVPDTPLFTHYLVHYTTTIRAAHSALLKRQQHERKNREAMDARVAPPGGDDGSNDDDAERVAAAARAAADSVEAGGGTAEAAFAAALAVMEAAAVATSSASSGAGEAAEAAATAAAPLASSSSAVVVLSAEEAASMDVPSEIQTWHRTLVKWCMMMIPSEYDLDARWTATKFLYDYNTYICAWSQWHSKHGRSFGRKKLVEFTSIMIDRRRGQMMALLSPSLPGPIPPVAPSPNDAPNRHPRDHTDDESEETDYDRERAIYTNALMSLASLRLRQAWLCDPAMTLSDAYHNCRNCIKLDDAVENEELLFGVLPSILMLGRWADLRTILSRGDVSQYFFRNSFIAFAAITLPFNERGRAIDSNPESLDAFQNSPPAMVQNAETTKPDDLKWCDYLVHGVTRIELASVEDQSTSKKITSSHPLYVEAIKAAKVHVGESSLRASPLTCGQLSRYGAFAIGRLRQSERDSNTSICGWGVMNDREIHLYRSADIPGESLRQQWHLQYQSRAMMHISESSPLPADKQATSAGATVTSSVIPVVSSSSSSGETKSVVASTSVSSSGGSGDEKKVGMYDVQTWTGSFIEIIEPDIVTKGEDSDDPDEFVSMRLTYNVTVLLSQLPSCEYTRWATAGFAAVNRRIALPLSPSSSSGILPAAAAAAATGDTKTSSLLVVTPSLVAQCEEIIERSVRTEACTDDEILLADQLRDVMIAAAAVEGDTKRCSASARVIIATTLTYIMGSTQNMSLPDGDNDSPILFARCNLDGQLAMAGLKWLEFDETLADNACNAYLLSICRLQYAQRHEPHINLSPVFEAAIKHLDDDAPLELYETLSMVAITLGYWKIGVRCFSKLSRERQHHHHEVAKEVPVLVNWNAFDMLFKERPDVLELPPPRERKWCEYIMVGYTYVEKSSSEEGIDRELVTIDEMRINCAFQRTGALVVLETPFQQGGVYVNGWIIDGNLCATCVKDMIGYTPDLSDDNKPIARTVETWTLNMEKSETITYPTTGLPLDCELWTGEVTNHTFGVNAPPGAVRTSSRVATISIWVAKVEDALRAMMSEDKATAVLSMAKEQMLYGPTGDLDGDATVID